MQIIEKSDLMRCCRHGRLAALNFALELEHEGVLKAFGVKIIGAGANAIDKTKDHQRFDKA